MQQVSGFEKGLLSFVKGDATRPIGAGNKIVVHICNNQGAWGAGFVLAVSRRWRQPESQYMIWKEKGTFDFEKFQLGSVQFINVEKDIVVANMIGQEGVGFKSGVPPIRYEAVRKCLKRVNNYAFSSRASVHMPRISCGLSGGDWQSVEPIIKEELINNGINVTVYDL